MAEIHPSADTLEKFMAGSLRPAEACEVVDHLLADCELCQQVTGSIWSKIQDGLRAARQTESPAEVPHPSAYGEMLGRLLTGAQQDAALIARERAAAPQLLAELVPHPQARRLTLIRNSRRFRSWGLCEQLIEASFDCRFDDVQAGVEFGELSVAVARQLDAEVYGRRSLQDLCGRAWTYAGNARRVVSDLRGAEKAFTEAASAFEEGTHDPLDRALLSRFQAHLMRARRRFAEAQRLQKRAVSLYRQCGETALAARVLADQGIGALYAGDPEKAMPLFEEALKLLDLKHDPRMAAAIRHNLAHCLSDLGLHDKALRLLRRVRAIYRNLGDELSLVRLRWLEGKVLHGLGQESLAEEALLEAREAFIDHDIAYDAALVSLDLASIYAAQGQPRKVRRLAEQMLPIFQSRDVHREALAALILFREAAKAERVTLALIREIGAYLEEARSHPGLAFRSSSS